MAGRQFKVTSGMLFTWFILAALILFLCPSEMTGKLQFAFAHVFKWPLRVGRSISLSASARMSDNQQQLKEMEYQNYIANLEEELRQKHQKIEQMGMHDRLYGLQGATLVPADITYATLSGSDAMLNINRGSSDGLARGQYVLGCNNIIGIVEQVSDRRARVKLVTDASSRIEVKIPNIDVDRMMQGVGGNFGVIRFCKKEVQTGEYVYARKKPGYLDSPIIIGVVSACQRNEENPLLWDITVQVACELENLARVDVIVMYPEAGEL